MEGRCITIPLFQISPFAKGGDTRDAHGLFGHVKGKGIRHCRVKDAKIYGGNKTGGLVDWLENGYVVSCRFSGEIHAQESNLHSVGGIFGFAEGAGSVVEVCENRGKLYARGDSSVEKVGGTVGNIKGGHTSKCGSYANLSAQINGKGCTINKIGCVVGYMRESESLIGCWDRGDIEVGVLDEVQSGKMKICSASLVGGVVGYVNKKAVINSCYYAGGISKDADLTDIQDSGAILGSGKECTLSQSYYCTDTMGEVKDMV